MFQKSFKIKSNVQLKGSECKKLRNRILAKYQLTDDDLNKLFSNKSTLSQLKIILSNEQICNVFSVDKRPIFFENSDGILCPTVYTLWILPELVPFFTTHPAVLPRLANGADLMCPGVIKMGQGLNSYGYHRKNDVVAVNLTSNKAAVGVGILHRSSQDLYMSGGVGICVKMLHVFGDKLWDIDTSVCQQIPNFGAAFEMPTEDDFPALGSNVAKPKKDKCIIDHETYPLHTELESLSIMTNDDNSDTIEKNPLSSESSGNEQLNGDNISATNIINNNDNLSSAKIPCETDDVQYYDNILKNAFFTALKRDGKSLTLPILTSNFYRCHVVPAAAIQQIDLKKTSFKKLSKFLTEMANEGFVTVKEEPKGVEKITLINFQHENLIKFELQQQSQSQQGVNDHSLMENKTTATNLFVTEMIELYLVTDETIKLFTQFDYGIGDGIEGGQIKKLLKEYIRTHKLQDPLNNRIVRPNELLINLCGLSVDREEYGLFSIQFDDLLATILSKMKHTFEMRAKNELKTANRPKIQMSIATRSGNKKVTIVSNLEAFGIRMNEFAKACKLGVAASSSVIKSPNQKTEQLMVQGNQVKFIFNLLTDTYKIPPKFINGLELAKKEKKSSKK